MSDQYEREAAKAAINTLERELYHARQQRDGWADECERSMRLLNDALDSCEEAMKQRDTLAEAAQAVVDRWEAPTWKELEPTAKLISALRKAIAAVKGGADD